MQKPTTIFTLLLLVIIAGVLTACSGQAAPDSAPTAPANNDNQNSGDALQTAPDTQPTYTAVPVDQVDDKAIEAYPSESLPVATALPDDYPAPLPTQDAYPGGLAWVQHPVGIQCEEGTLPGYETLENARTTLTTAGIRVKEAEVIDIPVVQQCGQPSSVQYRLQISADDLQTALSLGWSQSQ